MNINHSPIWGLGAGLAAMACAAFVHFRQPPSTFTCANGACASRDIDRAAFCDTRWYELGPKGWDAYKLAADLRRNVGSFSDADPRAAELLLKMKAIWVDAPVNPELVGSGTRTAARLASHNQSLASATLP